MFGLMDLASQHLGLSSLAVVAAAYAAWKYRRLQAWASLVIGGVSTVTFVVGTVVVTGLLGVALGWIDAGAVLADLTSWGREALDVVAGPLGELISGVIDD